MSADNLGPCERCGHPADWHRLDDALNISPTDPNAPFRCLGYDCEIGSGYTSAAKLACDCPDYVPLTSPERSRS